ncbi:MAG: hypothetical protein IIB45_09950 [Candidatus Marinimicrobia bacterium]|nr:hypothetical protein [Candidatus Neomarinimicrobiota bacterium]
MFNRLSIIALTLISSGYCDRPAPANLNHALALVDSMIIDGQSISYIAIYADAPDYQPVEAIDEGITCVDDVGRFLEVLEHSILIDGRRDLVPVARGMTHFLLYLSRDDGLWYNFMLADGSINKTHRNSVAEFGWWAVRGLRGLAAAYHIFRVVEPNGSLIAAVSHRIAAADDHIATILVEYSRFTKSKFGEQPAWLMTAPDQTCELILALTKLHGSGDFDYYNAITQFSQALVATQVSIPEHDLNGMYYSWENIWHAWGNNQSAALLEAYGISGEESFLTSVTLWAEHFIPFILSHQFPRRLIMNADSTYDMEQFPQIAYGINGMYRGIKMLADLTGKPVYENYSEQIYSWFSGENIARVPMYDAASGRCFDGITGPDSINRNSGAESTIECLLATQLKFTN